MNGGTDMTLAIELAALEELAYPERVFEDARSWSTYVGVVSEKPTYVVTNFTRKNRIRQDFFSGPRGKAESLESVKDQFDTERQVFIGTTDEDEAMADELDWEYLSVEDAAEAAEWTIAADVEDDEVDETEAGEKRDDWP
ncbi:hypothetical protein Halru_2316 [Halovivax ruber XH-70]|uniref:DUF7124 domain-containing protein n=2 Tax=Halovivax TaxID=332951 RepID=L0IFC0_HALRX|nr:MULTISPECIES: hypothetical protein [Halovivax]AGB16901.1 hypothetical protein Halru_2316 [Halovivax ruber XH-70]ELZ08226.1 hypothetical protein C479_12833 [Halovivax asiaticus JCM 14624]